MDMSNHNYSVYCHECKSNGKKYFGITNNISKRWEYGGLSYMTNRNPGTIFEAAIRKYGWDNFEHTVLHENISREEACILEQKYISEYKTNASRYGTVYGYNMTDGGDGAIGYSASAETRQKMSKTRKSIGIQRYVTELGNKARMKPVICLDTNEVFESIHAAARACGVSPMCISDCVRGKTKYALYMKWSYTTRQDIQSTLLSDCERQKIIDYCKVRFDKEMFCIHSKTNSKRLFCEELNKCFDSGAEAQRETGISSKAISYCVRGNSKTAGGYHWRYANQEDA